jgi:transposase
VPDEETSALRGQVVRRNQIVGQRTRLKNQVRSVLHTDLVSRYRGADLFGINAVHLENVLRKINTNRDNFVHGWLLFPCG